MKVEREEYLRILKKMGVDFTLKINTKRAVEKIKRALSRSIPVKNATDREKQIINDIGGICLTLVNTKAEKTTPKRIGGGRGALGELRNLFLSGKSFPRKGLIENLTKKYDSHPLAIPNYLALGKQGKLFGFKLVEEVKDGIKFVRKA